MTDTQQPAPPSWLKPVVDFAPLAAFLATYYLAGLPAATAALMAVTAVVLALAWFHTRKLAVVPLVTAAVVMVFGGLTLWLKDDTFIKLKPTIIYTLFAAVIAGGMARGKSVPKAVLGGTIQLDDAGWRKLGLRFMAFFLAMAVANEVIRATQTTDVWVLWKVPGSLVVTAAFMLAQGRLLLRHKLPDEGA